MFKETTQHTTKILLGRKDVRERMLYYSVYLNVTDIIFRLKKKKIFSKKNQNIVITVIKRNSNLHVFQALLLPSDKTRSYQPSLEKCPVSKFQNLDPQNDLFHYSVHI